MIAALESAAPVAGVKFKLENPYLAADTFTNWQSGRGIKIPVDRVLGPWPESDVAKLESASPPGRKLLPVAAQRHRVQRCW